MEITKSNIHGTWIYEYNNIGNIIEDVFDFDGIISIIRLTDKDSIGSFKRFKTIKIDEEDFTEELLMPSYMNPSSAYLYQVFDYLTKYNVRSIKVKKGSKFYFENYNNNTKKIQLFISQL